MRLASRRRLHALLGGGLEEPQCRPVLQLRSGACAFFVEFLRRCFNVRNEQVRVDCNLFADHLTRQGEIEQFWLSRLGLPQSCLRKSTVNRYSKHSQKKRQNKLPYGTCRVVVYDTSIVQSIYGSIQEYAGFERPEWLDC